MKLNQLIKVKIKLVKRLHACFMTNQKYLDPNTLYKPDINIEFNIINNKGDS